MSRPGLVLVGLFAFTLFATGFSEAASPASGPAQESLRPFVSFRAPDPDEEFAYVWQIIARRPFSRDRGYRVSLPDHPKFQELARAGVAQSAGDREGCARLFWSRIFKPQDYAAGLKALSGLEASCQKVWPLFLDLASHWGFNVWPAYEVLLTLYGPGGSYEPGTGGVRIRTTPGGAFARPEPFHSVVHEMVHLGVQETLVERFGLNHREKERLVDLICVLKLGPVLTDYRTQSRRIRDLDALVTPETVADLPAAVARYVENRPEGSPPGQAPGRGAAQVVLIEQVLDGSQAARAGLRAGDAVVLFGGVRVRSPDDLAREAILKARSEEIQVVILRGGRSMTFTLRGGPLGLRIGPGGVPADELPQGAPD